MCMLLGVSGVARVFFGCGYWCFEATKGRGFLEGSNGVYFL